MARAKKPAMRPPVKISGSILVGMPRYPATNNVHPSHHMLCKQLWQSWAILPSCLMDEFKWMQPNPEKRLKTHNGKHHLPLDMERQTAALPIEEQHSVGGLSIRDLAMHTSGAPALYKTARPRQAIHCITAIPRKVHMVAECHQPVLLQLASAFHMQ